MHDLYIYCLVENYSSQQPRLCRLHINIQKKNITLGKPACLFHVILSFCVAFFLITGLLWKTSINTRLLGNEDVMKLLLILLVTFCLSFQCTEEEWTSIYSFICHVNWPSWPTGIPVSTLPPTHTPTRLHTRNAALFSISGEKQLNPLAEQN